MNIREEYPPNIDKIESVLGPRRNPGVLFCYGDTIYNPSGTKVPDELVEHEKVHSERQLRMGVDAWWNRYLRDPLFRYDEELLAHVQECRVVARKADRAGRRRYASAAAKRLSGALYGNMTTFESARAVLRKVCVEELR